MTERAPMAGDPKPPPIYENDPGWTKERQDRVEKTYRDMNTGRIPPDTAAEQFSAVVEEIKQDFRGNKEKVDVGEDFMEASRMMREALYGFHAAHKHPQGE